MPEMHTAESGGSTSRYDRACRLFLASLEVDPARRHGWLQNQTAGDDMLLGEVEAMLRADEGYIDPGDPPTACWEHNEGGEQEVSLRLANKRRFPDIPNYEIVAEIARGGMGVVYKAEQQRPRRTVALKMMRSAHFASSAEVERFLAEAEAAARLDDATVVPVYEVGDFEGEPFIAMKFIDGVNLEQKLREGDMSMPDIVNTLLEVSYAVAAAHEKGIIHRDLKPSNIMIDAATQRPWVTDFGLAKNVHQDTSYTATGDVMGTPGYMAPEQAFGKSDCVSLATDVYGIGAILYRGLTGVPPREVDADNPVEAIQQIRNNDIVPPRQRDRRIPIPLSSICLKCLETNPEDRYPHAGELAADLERLLDGEEVLARPPSWSRQIFGWARTHPGLAISWCAIAVFFVYHLFCRYFHMHDDPRFDVAVIIMTGIATLSAWVWQKLLSKTEGKAWPLYAWTASDVTLLTILSLFAERDNSQLLMLYPVIVAASALRCRPQLVKFVTLISMFGYSIRLLVMRSSEGSEVDSVIEHIPMLLCLGVIGLIQYLLLRRSAASLEAKSALTSKSQLASRSGTSWSNR